MRPWTIHAVWLAGVAAVWSPVPVRAQISPGEYASRQVVITRALTRPRGKYSRVRTTSLVHHVVTEADEGLRVLSRYCTVVQDPLGPVRTEIGASFVAAMEPTEASLEVSGPPGGPWEVVIAPTVTVIGADLEDPWSDPLPFAASDSRVTDPDGDDQPGVTVQVSGMVDGQVYMTQRLVRELRGTLQADGTMRGNVIGGNESEVLGASNVLLRTFTPKFEPDPKGSDNVFEWIPLPPDTDCDQLARQAGSLFGED